MDGVKRAWEEASPTLTVTAAVLGAVGSAGVSGLIATLLRPKPADLDAVVKVADAFLATWPMSVAITVIVIGGMLGVATNKPPAVTLAAIAIVLWLGVLVGYQATKTPELDFGTTSPISIEPDVQVPPVGSPSQSIRAIGMAFDEYFKLYGANVLSGGIAGLGVGVFAVEFGRRLVTT